MVQRGGLDRWVGAVRGRVCTRVAVCAGGANRRHAALGRGLGVRVFWPRADQAMVLDGASEARHRARSEAARTAGGEPCSAASSAVTEGSRYGSDREPYGSTE